MKRREFIGRSAGLFAAASLGRSAGAQQQSADGPYLDAHVHPSSQALNTFAQARFNLRGDTPSDGAELVRRLDADGIHRAFALSTAYLIAEDATGHATNEAEEQALLAAENDFAARECARFPERLVPFLSVNPKRAYAIEEIDRCIDKQHMRGLKLHFWNSMVDTRKDDDLSRVRAVVQHAAERGLPVLAHVFVGAVPNYGPDDTTRFVREVVEATPKLRICFAHLGGAGGFGAPAQRCFEQLISLCGPESPLASRVWVDTAAVFGNTFSEPARSTLGQRLTAWGLGRVFWGSDSIDGALARKRSFWPLSQEAWAVIRNNRGESFCA